GLSTSKMHCTTCLVDFETDLERSVELTFVPASGIRSVTTGAFCVAGPRTTPHVLVQQLLAAGEERRLTPGLGSGRFRVRTLDGRGSSAFEVADDGADRLDVTVSD